jgi:MFS family permease
MTLEASEDTAQVPVRVVVYIGIVALATALGIGRFAFTPLLPLMQRDGSLDASTGAEWAAANYAGYLIGAMIAARLSTHLIRNLRLALVGIVASTALIAVGQTPWVGIALRFVAGILSAWILVWASGWCLATLARAAASHLGAWIYTGVGIGITMAGTLVWLGGQQSARLLWLELGALALVGSAYVLWQSRNALEVAAATVRSSAPRDAAARHTGLVLCYGAFGFGYIVPATFLPALARAQIKNPLVFGLTWPVFGMAATLSVALVARRMSRLPRRRIWAAAQAIMALGTGLPAITRGLVSLTISAALVGGTFMVATMAGLQLARELAPENPTSLLARMTAAFAAGQIAGPMLVRLVSAHSSQGWDGMIFASRIAAGVLAASAAWLWRKERNP